MAYLSRRSFLCRSLALAAAGSFARPSIAKAAATTATMWWAQGFVQDEDVALKQVVADYEKASGNKIDLSIIPFAPERQKIISALTSGVVPDLFNSNPGEIITQYGWKDQWGDVTDVVETQKANYHPTALLAAQAYNNVTKQRSFYGVPVTAAVVPIHIWRSLGEKAARPGYAQGLWPGFPGDGQRGRSEQSVLRLPDRLWRPEPLYAGRQGTFRRSGGEGGGDQGAELSDLGLQGRLCAAERHQLERCGRQQRLPRTTHGDGCGRDAVDRGGGQGR